MQRRRAWRHHLNKIYQLLISWRVDGNDGGDMLRRMWRTATGVNKPACNGARANSCSAYSSMAGEALGGCGYSISLGVALAAAMRRRGGWRMAYKTPNISRSGYRRLSIV